MAQSLDSKSVAGIGVSKAEREKHYGNAEQNDVHHRAHVPSGFRKQRGQRIGSQPAKEVFLAIKSCTQSA
jgi:hypothetical protein